MKAIQYFILSVFLVFALNGCKTTELSKVTTPVQITQVTKTGIVVSGASLSATTIDDSHKNQLSVFAAIDLSDPASAGMNQSLSRTRTLFRQKVRDIVTRYNIDGICLMISDSTPDIPEDIIVEALLLKPYLVTVIIYSGEGAKRTAQKCVDNNIADLILPESGTGSEPLKISFSEDTKKTSPGQIFGLDLSALFPGNPEGQSITINGGKTKSTDADGYIGFISLKTDSIELKSPNSVVKLLTADWSVPFRYSITPDGKAFRKSPWVEFREMPSRITTLPESDILCKTDYPATVKINDVPLKQYKTGIFFNKVIFNEGPNRVRAEVMTKDSVPVFYENEFIYHKTDKTRKPFPLWIAEKSAEPSSGVELLPDDILPVSFTGSKGQDGYVEMNPGKIKFKCSRADFSDYSLYSCDLPLRKLKTGKPSVITLLLVPEAGAPDRKPLELVLKHQVTVKEIDDFPYVKVAKDNSRLVYNLGAPRLGGPIRAELGPGIILKTNGKIGENYRIRLSRSENGFIGRGDVQLMPPETAGPSFYIESMSCGPSGDCDMLTIPCPKPVPYEVWPDPGQKRIIITLFGVETASTWITHLEGRKIIDNITWEQTTPETYRIFVNLKTPAIWGYNFKKEGSRLVLRVKYPPQYDLTSGMPLKGLKIAIEAGHGGSGTGAIGLSGLVEKDINLDLSFRLGDLLKSKGADVLQVRDSDKDMLLTEKRDAAINYDADMLICVHANAGGRGYLSANGTSTYYNNPFWSGLAEDIYTHLLELGLKEFGVVGSFNYTVIRVTDMPAVLVEQAFMTHAEDEEKLADPEFRQKEAEKIYAGILDYLRRMNDR